MVSGIILAGGSSTRYGTGENKTLVELLGRPVLEYSLRVFLAADVVDEVVLAAKAGEEAALRKLAEGLCLQKPVTVVTGGADRAASVEKALAAARGERVLIHDGARPLVTERMLEDCLAALEEADGATIATPSRDTVKLADGEGFVAATTDRSRTWLVQTPQAFYREELLALHRALGDGPERGQITDDCMLLERAGRRVKLVPGSCRNLKITATRSCSLPESRSMPRPARAAMRSASHTFSSRRIWSALWIFWRSESGNITKHIERLQKAPRLSTRTDGALFRQDLNTNVQTSEAFPMCLRRPYLFPCVGKDRGEKGAWMRLVHSANTVLTSTNY